MIYASEIRPAKTGKTGKKTFFRFHLGKMRKKVFIA